MKTLHFSIDDVTLTNNLMFAHLVTWHKVFGLKVTLYCYADKLAVVPDTKFYHDNAKWLKLGFHSKDEKPFSDDIDYKKSYMLAQKNFCRLRCGKTDKLRLHCWNATDEQVKFISRNGIHVIFTSQMEYYHKKYSLMYRPTNICFEQLQDMTNEALCIGASHIAAFTHEWCFGENVHKIEEALLVYNKKGYIFVA